MAEGFKIADAFVEVEAKLDQRQVTKTSTEAGHRSSRGFGDGFKNETRKRKGGLVGSVTSALGKLPDVASRIGTKMGSGIVSGISDVAPKLGASLASALSNPYVVAGVGVAAIALGSFIGAAVNGAILAALGTGVVAAGVALAFNDARVKDEAQSFGMELMAGLNGAASSFLTPVREAIGDVRSEFRVILPEINDIFSEAARYVRPLTAAVTGFIRNILPGIRTAVANMGPIFATLEEGLPEIGATIGNLFSTLSEHSESAGKALEAVLELVEFGINNLTTTVESLTMAWEAWLVVSPLGWLTDLALGSNNGVLAIRRLDKGTQDLTKSTEQVVDETKTFIAVLDRLNATAINAIDTEGAYQRAVDEVARAKRDEHAQLVMTNGALVQNTERQRAGAAAINEVAKAALARAAAAHEAALKTGTLAQADAAARVSIEKSRVEFIKLAEKLGLSASQAKELADQLLAIPKNVTTKVTTTFVKVGGGYQLSGDEGPRGHAQGGLIRGPGTGTSDSIVRRLSDGEYVIRAAAVKRIGVGALDQMNRGASPAAATGGGSTATATRERPSINVNLTVNGVLDRDIPRRTVAALYDALNRYEKGYA